MTFVPRSGDLPCDAMAAKSRLLRLGIPALVVAILGGWVVWKLFLDVASPDEVSTQAALEQLAEDTARSEDTGGETASVDADEGALAEQDDQDEVVPATDDAEDGGAATTSSTVPFDGVLGRWLIDDEFGDFSFDNASGSFAGFRVEKSLFVGGAQTAVGRSAAVTGSITIGVGELTAAEIVVDTMAMQSDRSQRESAIRRVLQAGAFPTATFVVTQPVAIDTDALDAGQTVAVEVIGDLTIAGVTNTITIPIEATVAETGLGVVVGSTSLVWSDYGVETPTSSAGTVADDGILEFQLVVRRG